ncbi:MAG: cation diffusion facilitator family transporter [Gemmatimonadota bacterium]|nr:cation diffusion facilitator family transporter [Gemmatimonadota bacterium]MDH5196543.1 cation diffusion facilitator family transporter [Gemmatimonadota bacterium]
MSPVAPPTLRRYAVASLIAAAATIGLKGAAYALTGSVGLLSDALESVVNLLAAGGAFLALTIAARPADEDHAYGHNKVEYFSSGFEGALILVAAGGIGYAAIRRLLAPQPLEQAGLGLVIAAIAAAINLVTARVLFRAGQRHRSIVLEADAQHLMTDVWTSVGVIAGVALSSLTGWRILDPLVALAVAVHILRTGMGLLRGSALGLLDTGLPENVRAEIVSTIERYTGDGARYHALRTRQAGRWRFISFHVLVPGDWTVQRGHDLLERIEEDVRSAVPGSTVFTHLEPIEDPVSFQDEDLERPGTSDS